MKQVVIAAVLLLGFATFAVRAVPRQASFQATTTQMPQQKQIGIMAQSIQRAGGVTHATGNVQVRIASIPAGEDRTLIRADEVIYHGETGELETRGDAHITIEKVK